MHFFDCGCIYTSYAHVFYSLCSSYDKFRPPFNPNSIVVSLVEWTRLLLQAPKPLL